MIFTREQFEAYEDEFNNARDKGAFYDRYYAPGAEFIHPVKGTFRGKDELVSFWNAGDGSGHDGIHEILHLTDFIATENRLAVQLHIEWRCFKDTDYLGPRKKGEVFWGKCAAFYTIADGKFTRVELYLNLREEGAGRSSAADADA